MKNWLPVAILAAVLLIAPASFAAEAPKVEIFTTSWCGYCVKAVSFLRANKIPFIEYDVEKDANAARRRQELAGRGGVPFAVINGKKILGWSEQSYRKALGLD